MKQLILETLKAKIEMDKYLLDVADTIIKARHEEGLYGDDLAFGESYTNHSVEVLTDSTTMYLYITETEDFEDYQHKVNIYFPIDYLDKSLKEIFEAERENAKVVVMEREQREIQEALSVIKNAGGSVIWSNQ
jgi:hypothetical protein